MKKRSDTDWKRLVSMPDKDIDFSDIPELDEAFFTEARWRPPVKQPVTIRLDADVLEFHRIEPSLLYYFSAKPKNAFSL